MFNPALEDALGAARSYLHAIKLAVEGSLKGGDDYCAFLLLIEAIGNELKTAQQIIDRHPGTAGLAPVDIGEN